LEKLGSFWTYRRTLRVDGEIVARIERRRQWTPREKAALLAEIEAEGGQVSLVAQRHGISKSLLYNWRSAWKAASLAGQGSAMASAGFIQLGIVADPSREGSARRMAGGPICGRGAGSAPPEGAGVMEIELPDGVRVRVDGRVEELALRRVLAAVRGSR
jgi:transposase